MDLTRCEAAPHTLRFAASATTTAACATLRPNTASIRMTAMTRTPTPAHWENLRISREGQDVPASRRNIDS